MNLVKIISKSIESGRHLIKSFGFGRDDVQEVNQMSQAGIDSSPIEGMVAMYSPTSTQGENFIVGYINSNQVTESGEVRIYATNDSGVLQSYIHCKKDGDIIFSSEADNLVRFSALETAFNELKADYNDLAGKWNAFASTYIPGGPSIVGTPPTAATGSISTANISPARITEFKAP